MSKEGVITGTPTKEAQDYEFGVIASAEGYKGVLITFKISVLHKIEFEACELPNGKIGVSYLQKLPEATSYNTAKYRLANSTSLPHGLELTESGYIVGTPTTTVTDHEFSIMVYADFSMSVVQDFKISIGLSYNKIVPDLAKVGEEYEGEVVRVEDYGAFVHLFGNVDGLCHVSRLGWGFIDKASDVVKLGDIIKVRITEIDDHGKVKVSHREFLEKPENYEERPAKMEHNSRPDNSVKGPKKFRK